MKYTVCAIRDRAADVFSQPFFVASTGQAIRSFGDAVNGDAKDSAVCQHPEDFDLYFLGLFNDEDGSFICEPPKQIAIGKDMKVKV